LLDPLVPLEGRAFSVSIAFTFRDARIAYEAAIRLTGDRGKPFWLLSWLRSPQPR
jgi:hypothetical protein